MLRHRALELALLEIRQLLDADPTLTGAHVVAALETELGEDRNSGIGTDIVDETCSRCGRQIIVSSNGYVTHVSADGGLNRGCRAASFQPDHGWDDNIPPSWYAKRAK